MHQDLFISYAHQGDNTSREAVAELVAKLHTELEADFHRRFGRNLKIFFDKEDIRDFDHWQVRCHRALRDSRFFIACLSRAYLHSDACRWEWEEWCRHELEHGLVGQGAASLWFVKPEDLDASEDAATLRHWGGELLHRFHIPWQENNSSVFLDATARSELQRFTAHIAQQLRMLIQDPNGRGNLPWPNVNFVGREPELARLHNILLDEQEQSLAGIHGVGGMGKTALAQAFAYHETEAFPGGCWLLRCEGRDQLLSVFRPLSTELEIDLSDLERMDDAKAVQRVLDVLRPRGPALFLLDNVDRPALLTQEQVKLLADYPRARLLYTTRLAPNEFTRVGAVIRQLDLDSLPENQAVDLIRRYQPELAFASSEHEDTARDIVRELSGLTLAVETAAVYLGQHDSRSSESQYSVDIRDYLLTLRDDLRRDDGEGMMSQLREVSATLHPTLARLDAPTRMVLQSASLLAPVGLGLPWIRAVASKSHPELATDASTGENDPWTHLIRRLIGMNLFHTTPDPRIVTIHRILHRVLETELRKDHEVLFGRIRSYAGERSTVLEKTWHNPESQWEITVLRDLLQHSLDAGSSELIGLLISFCEWFNHYDNGKNAERLLSCAVQILENQSPLDNEKLVILLSDLGHSHANQEEWRKALGFFQRARDLEETLDGNHDHGKIVRLINLGAALHKNGKFDQAEEILRRAVSTGESTPGLSRTIFAAAMNDLAALLQETNRLEEAEKFHGRALKIDEEIYGPNHPIVAVDLNNRAELLKATNQFEEAEPLLRRALGIDEQRLGPNHLRVATDLKNLAETLQATDRLEEAEPLMRRSLDIMRSSGQQDHSQFAVSLSNYAIYLRKLHRLEEAADYLWESIQIEDQCLPAEHPKRAHRRNNLALVLLLGGKSEEAFSVSNKAWELKKIVEGGHDRTSARILFVRLAICWITGTGAEKILGQLHTLLTQGDLPCYGDVSPQWDAGDVIDLLSSNISEPRVRFLAILVSVLNGEAGVDALDEFAEWRETMPMPLD